MAKKIQETLGSVRDVLAERQSRIRTRTIDLRRFKVRDNTHFEVDGLELFAGVQGESGVDTLPIKQLCSAIGMSSGFYFANPHLLNHTIFEQRFQGLEEDEAARVVRYIETDQGNRVLAILPVHHQAPNYTDVIDPLSQSLPPDTEIRLTNHPVVDKEHRFSLRLSTSLYPFDVKPQDRQVGEPCELGFFLDMSEDGRGSKMVMTSMVYNLSCTNGAMVSYDNHPYFSYNYRGIRAVDLAAAIRSSVGRFAEDQATIQKRLLDTEAQKMSKIQAQAFLKALESRRDVSSGFIRKVRKYIEGVQADHITKWRLVNHLTQEAQRLPYDQRVQHETVAGQLLGLNLKLETSE